MKFLSSFILLYKCTKSKAGVLCRHCPQSCICYFYYFVLTGGLGEYRGYWYRGWKSQADVGVAMEHHSALAGGERPHHFSIDLENVLVLYSLSTATKSRSHSAWPEQDMLITLKFWGLQVPDPSVSKADFFFPGALGESGPCLSLLLVCCKMDCAGLCKLSLCLHDTHSAAFPLCFGEDTSHAPSSMTLPYVVLCAT